MAWYDAVFNDGQQMRTVGPFDSPGEADEFGHAHHGEQLDYLGWAERTGRVELDRVIGAELANAMGEQPGPTWYGVVTRWDVGATHGFVTDGERRSWFVSRDDLPGDLGALDSGTEVSFTGRPKPKPGKKYPQAYSVRFMEPR